MNRGSIKLIENRKLSFFANMSVFYFSRTYTTYITHSLLGKSATSTINNKIFDYCTVSLEKFYLVFVCFILSGKIWVFELAEQKSIAFFGNTVPPRLVQESCNNSAVSKILRVQSSAKIL